MSIGQRLSRLIVLGAALLLPTAGAAKISQEIFAMKANKFAEETFHARLTFSPRLQADPKVIEALQNVWPDNRLLPPELKALPVVEITGGEHLVKAYTKAKAWFNPTLKTFVKVARGTKAGHQGEVLFLGFAETAAPLFSQELDRVAAGAQQIDAILEPKLAKLDTLEQRIEAKIKVIDQAIAKEAHSRQEGMDALRFDTLIYAGGAAALALLALINGLVQASARRKMAAMLKDHDGGKGGEPSSYLKL